MIQALLILFLYVAGPGVLLILCSVAIGTDFAIRLWRYAARWIYAVLLLLGAAGLAHWGLVSGVAETDTGPQYVAALCLEFVTFLSAFIAWTIVSVLKRSRSRDPVRA
ncbi:hypothetical protein [Methylorubrum extorquens]|uniref:Transmembrane protein n=1 Tax=Methylorubrum extorquens (strain CM4 / NCIMB 13688) TaxID=440085 RepID=B7KVB5_METC4|nr:hypothetical protein [Methylorubrum extorquens]ACK84323.1 conserved hypothetical protein [Methylorubrum extorquens CM4]